MEDMIRLTTYSPAGGCGCKLGPEDLAEVLDALRLDEESANAGLAVGSETMDDAAVIDVGGTLIAFTLDFFTPIVDDPYDWGQVTAANALSDIYAMGGDPVAALNIVAWPEDDTLPRSLLTSVMAGGRDKVREAGALTVGGHTIRDEVPKYGLALIGTIGPEGVLRNSTARPGDQLIITKAIGTGVIATATKNGVAPQESQADSLASMKRLNASAARLARVEPVSACTDVSGFGLLGHLGEMTRGSGLAAELSLGAIPVLSGVEKLITLGMSPSGAARNWDYMRPRVTSPRGVSKGWEQLLSDPQTSGGLLLAVAPDLADSLVSRLRAAGDLMAAVIGVLVGGVAGTITVTP